jgi:hypothetical protein
VHAGAAAAGFDAGLDDGEPESAAAGLAVAAGIDSIEGLEEAREAVGGDAGAVVGDAEVDAVTFAGGGDFDVALGGVEAGVTEDVADAAAEEKLTRILRLIEQNRTGYEKPAVPDMVLFIFTGVFFLFTFDTFVQLGKGMRPMKKSRKA